MWEGLATLGENAHGGYIGMGWQAGIARAMNQVQL
jgi:hypothetical protein